MYLCCTFSYKSEHFTCKGSLDVESKISEHDQKKKDVVEETSCKNAFVHRCLAAAEVFFHRHHFFTLTLDELNTIEKTLVHNTVKGLKQRYNISRNKYLTLIVVLVELGDVFQSFPVRLCTLKRRLSKTTLFIRNDKV